MGGLGRRGGAVAVVVGVLFLFLNNICNKGSSPKCGVDKIIGSLSARC